MSSRPSFPAPPTEPSLRRLGVGPGNGGERPLRAAVLVAVVGLAALVAVPLYLLRHPSPAVAPSASASASGSASAPTASVQFVPSASATSERAKLGPVQRVRCSASPKDTGATGDQCDQLAPIEAALEKAAAEAASCAPRASANEEGSISFVLRLDFANKSSSIYPGKSGKWHGKQARKATRCAEKALKVDWSVPHQHRFYMIAVLATFPPPSASSPGVGGPIQF